MPKRGYKVASVLAITILIVLAVAGVALAAKWSDINSSVLAGYSLTEQDLINISDGYADGTWQPQANMQRQYFTKMTAKAYNINTSNPGTPIFHDVPSTSIFFPSIQAEYKLGMIKGTSDDFFSPANTITRQQAAAIIARFVANAKGWDLDTFATDEEVASILENFPDAEAVYPGLKREVAFAISMGILRGTGPSSDTLMIAPTRAMTRIEGAAMITRSLAIASGPPPAKPPAKVDLDGRQQGREPDRSDASVHLQGDRRATTIRFAGALVDFDSEQSPWYVGNVQPEAALTGADGMVTVNLHLDRSRHPARDRRHRRCLAPRPTISPIGTKYWLALDEVYIRDATRCVQNNAGVAHAWEAQVIVFGPGPLSTSQQDWYNLIADRRRARRPSPLDGIDGYADVIGYGFDYSSYADELDWTADGYHARSMAGIPVLWTVDGRPRLRSPRSTARPPPAPRASARPTPTAARRSRSTRR